MGSFATLLGSLQATSELTGGIMARKQAKRNAKQQRKQGAQAEEQARREGKKLKGAQRARFAKGGVDPDVGTPLDVVLESEEQAQLEGRRRRLAFESEADIQEQAGTVALLQGLFGSGSTLLGTLERNAATKKPKGITT